MRKPFHQSSMVVLGFILLVGMVGCAVKPPQIYWVNGRPYCVRPPGIWRGTWYQHYAVGKSCAEGEYWEQAIASFQAALQFHRGKKDRWYANTYGVHVIADYFPRRELGISLHHLGRYDEAEAALEDSLRDEDSSKAKFYLNKTRKARLQQSQQDQTPPQLQLVSPVDGLLTNKLTVEVRGYAEDNTFVAALAINGREEFVELAQPRVSIQRKVELKDGTNRIDIVATDLLERQTRRSVTVHLDRYGPQVSLERVELFGKSPYQRVRVQGVVVDHNPLARFVLAGEEVKPLLGTEKAFREERSVAPNTTSLLFEVTDMAGNVTRGEIPFTSLASGEQGTREGKSPQPEFSRWASLYPFTTVNDLSTSSPALPWLATEQHSLDGKEKKIKTPPTIQLISSDPDRRRINCPLQPQDEKKVIVTYKNAIYFQLLFADETGITGFSINGKSHWDREGMSIYYSAFEPLTLERENGYLIEAKNREGKTTQCRITVVYKVPKAKRIDQRLTVLFESFKTKPACEGPLAVSVHGAFKRILEEWERFNLIDNEKNEKNISTIEGLLRGNACETTLTKSKADSLLVTAEFMFVEADQNVSRITCHLKQNCIIVDVYQEEFALGHVRNLMHGLALKLLELLPLEEGEIRWRNRKIVRTTLSQRNKVQRLMKLIVFREASPESTLGEAQITDVSEEISQAKLLKEERRGEIKPDDKVITK